jgi:hypothetical protein
MIHAIAGSHLGFRLLKDMFMVDVKSQRSRVKSEEKSENEIVVIDRHALAALAMRFTTIRDTTATRCVSRRYTLKYDVHNSKEDR